MITAGSLFDLSNRLETIGRIPDEETFLEPMNAISSAAEEIGRSWCGSWLGYHSRVYYKDLAPVPAGAHFSQEWGFLENIDRKGQWQEFEFDAVVARIYEIAGNSDISSQEVAAAEVTEQYEDLHSEVRSCLSVVLLDHPKDSYLVELLKQIEGKTVYSESAIVRAQMPSGRIMTRDTLAMQQGITSPPHIAVSAKIAAIRHPFHVAIELSKLCRRAASHLQNVEKRAVVQERIGTNVFIGHGRSLLWRELKDFVQDRLHLPWDEFNRVPVAGTTNIARLSQMLDEAAIAFLIMTAEDEQEDGTNRARQNVVHEAGLFQGRLGFQRAIVLLEDGCDEFSNIHGLGQIRFPRDNLSAAFEEIRQVMEREGIVEGGNA